jgi:aerobic C4-dicarboxylate transport protein
MRGISARAEKSRAELRRASLLRRGFADEYHPPIHPMPPQFPGKAPAERAPWYRILYIQVLIAVALGIAVGYFWPDTGKTLKPLGDLFINLVKMIIAPIIFCTVVHGIASMSDVKKLGRIGGKTLLYFFIVSTFALVLGLVVVNVMKPGAGLNIDVRSLDPKAVASSKDYAISGHSMNAVDFLMKIVPVSFFDAFAKGDILQVLLVALLSAFSLSAMGPRGEPIIRGIDLVARMFFGIINLIVRAAPVGAFGAMAYTVGSFGLHSLGKLAELMAGFYITSALFVVVVLGAIARAAGFSIFSFLSYIKDELLLVLGTSSSETALPGILQKMQDLGCAPATVGLVIPTGYSFNLDGTNIYMSMAAIFLAQATNTPLDLGHQITLLVVAMLSSKGASGVTGAGFIVLCATLSAVPGIPVESVAILVGIDRFMSECRSITNLIGNGVATIVISRLENEITPEQLQTALRAVKSPDDELLSKEVLDG